ncbi:MAG TPA: VWA domain-containing protein [Pyrinomonadaceae bacterium]|jgi:VWFA-related protein|nr:VWA domain-containing protein [Pyrinomonadaceae bacterium]
MTARRLIALSALVAMLWAVPSGGTAPFIARALTPQSRVAAPRPSAIPANIPFDQDAEVVRVETNLVNTLFTAIDNDRHFLTSLRAEDIAIFENDVSQPISLFERETNRPLSLVLLIDTSNSQRGVLDEEKNAARVFVDSVIRPDKDRAAIVSFTGVPRVEQESTNELSRLQRGIVRVKIDISPENERRIANGDDPLPKEQDPSGYTGIWDSMWMSVEDLLSKAPEGTRRAIVLLSDGDDTSSTVKRQDVIDLAVKSEVAVYSIGFRDADFQEGKLDSGALRKVSNRTGGRAFFPTQPSELESSFAQIDQELRSQYLIAYSPTNKNHDGSYRRVRIEIVNPALRQRKPQLLYRQGYYARRD